MKINTKAPWFVSKQGTILEVLDQAYKGGVPFSCRLHRGMNKELKKALTNRAMECYNSKCEYLGLDHSGTGFHCYHPARDRADRWLPDPKDYHRVFIPNWCPKPK